MTRQLCIVFAFLLVGISASQELRVTEIGHFEAANGTVALLPRGVVLKRESGRLSEYSYRGGRFVAIDSSSVDRDLANWNWFDWASVDYLDQVERHDFDADIIPFLPHGAKVKRVVDLQQDGGRSPLILICYTLPIPEVEEPIGAADKDVYAMALTRQPKKGIIKVWAKKLQTQCSFGGFVVQEIPGVGRVLALYSAAVGPSSGPAFRQLRLFLVQ